jgi:hypothetical protein
MSLGSDRPRASPPPPEGPKKRHDPTPYDKKIKDDCRINGPIDKFVPEIKESKMPVSMRPSGETS